MYQGEIDGEELNCISIATNDTYALTVDYFDVVKQRLSDEEDPPDFMTFVIITSHHNLKKKFIKTEQFFKYELKFDVDVRQHKKNITDINKLTDVVINDMFSRFKKHIILH